MYQPSYLMTATAVTYFTQNLLRLAVYNKQAELRALQEELDIENDRKAVEIANATVQQRMRNGDYMNVEQMEADLEFEIEVQKAIHRNQ
jgi:hypothetical protein